MQTKTPPLVESGQREQRAVTLDQVEFRADDDTGKLEFRGHAAVFDEWTEIPSLFGDSFLERIQRGAFRKVLNDGADVRFLINHDGLPLARTAAGTMTLKEDTKGLRVDAELAPTTVGKDLGVLLKRGDISQMSFGFRVGKHEVEHDEDNGVVRRTITEFSDLFDVSPVTFPAYEGTDAGLRALGLVGDDGELDEQRLWDLALKVFRGDKNATEKERAAIDAAFSRTSRVSPWMAEQAARAYAREPELRAALQGIGITLHVDDKSTTEPPVGAGLSASAARAWLDVLAA